MTAKAFSNALDEISDKYITEVITYKRKQKNIWLKWGMAAACLCFVLVGIAVPVLNNEMPALQPEVNTSQQEEPSPVFDESPTNKASEDYVEILEFNEAEYVVFGKDETAVLQECGISSELTQELAGEHVCYLGFEKSASSYRYFPVEKAGSDQEKAIELFEYAPEPNENVYILRKDGEYYVAIRKDMLYGNY